MLQGTAGMDDQTVPVIDLAAPPAQVRDQLARACAAWGFFHLANHGLAPGLMAAVMAETRGLFAAPPADKRALSRTRDNPWG